MLRRQGKFRQPDNAGILKEGGGLAKRRPASEVPCLWERQEGESEAAWLAFLAFRDMEGKRTVAAVVKKCGKSRSLIDRWRKRWEWDKRILAYDNELQKAVFAEEVKGRREMNKRQIGLSALLQKAAMEALKTKDFSRMFDKDIIAFIRLAAELERTARMDDISIFEREVVESSTQKSGALTSDSVSAAEGESIEDTIIYLPENGREGQE